MVSQYHIPVRLLKNPLLVTAVSGQVLTDPVRFITEPLELQVGWLHVEKISLYVLPELSHSLLLGLPWLRMHNPVIEWSSGEVLQWGQLCQGKCLCSIQRRVSISPPKNLEALPVVYHSFADVFDKKEAETLPPHRPYDCPIDLLSGTSPPRGRVYPLSPAESQATADYIKENLERGFIRKSSSPAGAGFFFVKKKDGSLRPWSTVF